MVGLARFVVDRDAYQGPSPTFNAVPVVTLQRQLATPNLAWDYLLLHEPDALDAFFALADVPRVAGADVKIGGRRDGLFGHDYRRTPVDDLVHLWADCALAQDPLLRPETTPDLQVLSQQEFTEAVRQALRDLHRPDVLARNPLLSTRVAYDRAGGRPGRRHPRRLGGEAVAALAHHPRDDKLLRAVERTYLDPAPTQETGGPARAALQHLPAQLHPGGGWNWSSLGCGIARCTAAPLRREPPRGEHYRALIGLETEQSAVAPSLIKRQGGNKGWVRTHDARWSPVAAWPGCSRPG